MPQLPILSLPAPYHPVDDPLCSLTYQEIVPATGGPKWPFLINCHGGGFRLIPNSPNTRISGQDFASRTTNPFIVWQNNYRLAPPGNVNFALPGQTTIGYYSKSLLDVRMFILAARADPRCNGKVGIMGGSAGGYFAVVCCGTGVAGADRADFGIGLSGPYDFSDRQSDVSNFFISDVQNYCNVPDDTGTNLATQLANSAVTLIGASINPILVYNSATEAMPASCLALLATKLAALGVTNATIAPLIAGSQHAYGYWEVIKNDVFAFADAHLGSGPALPFILSSTPLEGPVGTSVIITGTGFTGATLVQFNGVSAGFVVNSATQITAIVAIGTTSGAITVTTPAGTGTGSTFTVTSDGGVVPPPPPPPLPPPRSPILQYPVGGLPPEAPQPPGPPINLLATTPGTPSSGTATIVWDAPLDLGGSPTLLPYRGFLTGGSGTVPTMPGNTLGVTVTGLDPGADYIFHLFAETVYGESDEATVEFASDPTAFIDPGAEPRGVIRLLSATNGVPIWDTTNAPFWGKAYIDGSRYRTQWNVIQPGPDATVFNWDDLDAYMDQCDTFNKIAGVSIAAGIYTPQWVYDLRDDRGRVVVPFFHETGPDAGNMAIPWSFGFTQMWNNFIKVFATRYDSRTSLKYVVIGGLGQIIETYMVQDQDVAAFTAVAQSYGFNTIVEAWVSAAQSIIRNYYQAFKQTSIILSLANVVPNDVTPLNGDDANNMIVNWALLQVQRRFGIMNAGLNGGSNVSFVPNQLIHDNSINFRAGFQFATRSDDPNCDPTQVPPYVPELGLRNTFHAGATALKGKFIEIYPTDADSTNPAYATDMAGAQTLMLANPNAIVS